MKSYRLISIGIVALFLAACGAEEMTKDGTTFVIIDSDKKLFEQATEYMDATYCENIQQSQLQTDCVNIVESNTLITQAVDKNDEKTCKKIKIVEYRTICEKLVTDRKTENEKKVKEIAEWERKDKEAAQKIEKILESGNIEKCKELARPEDQETCEIDVKANSTN